MSRFTFKPVITPLAQKENYSNERILIQAYMDGKRSFERGEQKPDVEYVGVFVSRGEAYMLGWIAAQQKQLDLAKSIFKAAGAVEGSVTYNKAVANAEDAINDSLTRKAPSDNA